MNLRRNAVLLCNLLLRVYVHLCELYAPRLGLLLGKCVKYGRNRFAGTAPVGVEVDDGVCGRGDELLEM